MRRLGLILPCFCFAFVLGDSLVLAQPPGRPDGGRGGLGQPGGRGLGGRGLGGPGTSGGRAGGGGRQAGQPYPWVAIFDTDQDGELSAEEIKNATASLLTLDRNNDGRIGGDELRPGGTPARPAGIGAQQGDSAARGGDASRGQAGRGLGGRGLGGRSLGGRGLGGIGLGNAGPRGARAGTGRPREGGRPGGDPAQADAAFAAQIKTLDSNRDGLITMNELPDHMHKAFLIADEDKSGSLGEKELVVLASQFRRNKLNPDSEQERKNAPTRGARPQ
ncbi:MAG: hypothetical protein AAGG48_10965 [Planctomycetota bacterium]